MFSKYFKKFNGLALILALLVPLFVIPIVAMPVAAGTYDYTGDGNTTPPASAYEKFVVLHRYLDASAIIASDSTLTTAAKITAGDVIQAIDVPARFLCLGSALYVVAPEGAAETVDIGIGGGDELQDGASDNGTAGTAVLTLVGDDWGPDNLTGYFFSAADTIDVTYVSDTTTADLVVVVWGILVPDENTP
jgi:hypothetical protein